MATAQERWVSAKFELHVLSGEGLSVALLGLRDAIGTQTFSQLLLLREDGPWEKMPIPG